MVENVQLIRKENADSLEIGTPSKGGTLKIYLDFNDKLACKEKIDRAISVKEYANAQINIKFGNGESK